jgi:hypothetical protein
MKLMWQHDFAWKSCALALVWEARATFSSSPPLPPRGTPQGAGEGWPAGRSWCVQERSSPLLCYSRRRKEHRGRLHWGYGSSIQGPWNTRYVMGRASWGGDSGVGVEVGEIYEGGRWSGRDIWVGIGEGGSGEEFPVTLLNISIKY